MPGETPATVPPDNALTRIGAALIAIVGLLAPVTLLGEFLVSNDMYSEVIHGICLCSHGSTLGYVVRLWRSLDKTGRAQWRNQFNAICLTVSIVSTLSAGSIFAPLHWMPRYCIVLFQGLAAISSGLVAVLETVRFATNHRRWRISSLMHQGKYQAALELLKPIVAGVKFDVQDILNAATCYLELGDICEGNRLIERARAMPGRTVYTSYVAACAYMDQRRYTEALAILESVSENDTDLSLWYKCCCLNALNRNDESRIAWQRLKESSTEAFLQSLFQNPDCRRVIELIEKIEPTKADG